MSLPAPPGRSSRFGPLPLRTPVGQSTAAIAGRRRFAPLYRSGKQAPHGLFERGGYQAIPGWAATDLARKWAGADVSWRNALDGLGRPVYGGYVVNEVIAGVLQPGAVNGGVRWAALQPNGPYTDLNLAVIRDAVAEVRAWNAVPGHVRQGLILRVFSGQRIPLTTSPAGLSYLTLGGTFWTSCFGTASFRVGRFWTPPWRAAATDFIRRLAAAVDSIPEILMIAFSPDATQGQEPMIREDGQLTIAPGNAWDGIGGVIDPVTNILAAGYTPAQDLVNQTAWWQTMAALFVQTYVRCTYNPFQVLTGPNSTNNPGPPASANVESVPNMEQIMAAAVAALSPLAAVGNNSLRWTATSNPAIPTTIAQGYAYAKLLTALRTIQTGTLQAMTAASLVAVIGQAGADGATALELPNGYSTTNSGPNGTTPPVGIADLQAAVVAFP